MPESAGNSVSSTGPSISTSNGHPISNGDRFIPNRSCIVSDSSRLLFSSEQQDDFMPKTDYEHALAENCLGKEQASELLKERILAYSQKPPVPTQTGADEVKVVYSLKRTAPSTSQKQLLAASGAQHRVIPTTPFRTLDAPDLVDDFYLNLLDWSTQNIVAVALGGMIYLWNGNTASTTELCSLPEDVETHYTSVRFTRDGCHLALGLSDNTTQLWDLGRSKQLRTFRTHSARVSSLAWNGPLLSTGSKDFEIHNHDVRVREHLLSKMGENFHQQEVCSLEWSPDGSMLASGGNDNMICLTDEREMSRPRCQLTEHRAAVKALSWCPWQRNLLASGAGSNDQTVKIWNASSGSKVTEVVTDAQVTQVKWSFAESGCRELAVSHGFSRNGISLWRYPSMERAAELCGHTSRILSMAQSPDGSTLLTAGADETLRFWKVFPPCSSGGADLHGSSALSGPESGISRAARIGGQGGDHPMPGVKTLESLAASAKIKGIR
ncbi:unnamed protein product [Amoebophrya sp. A25]|nr:unnamed protein product [Amoebophrya sp. A25]|eukprot:GSA25T00015961001.1